LTQCRYTVARPISSAVHTSRINTKKSLKRKELKFSRQWVCKEQREFKGKEGTRCWFVSLMFINK
ncbi:MAG: hypothetical protein ACK53Y_21760, partial [bacterium]